MIRGKFYSFFPKARAYYLHGSVTGGCTQQLYFLYHQCSEALDMVEAIASSNFASSQDVPLNLEGEFSVIHVEISIDSASFSSPPRMHLLPEDIQALSLYRGRRTDPEDDNIKNLGYVTRG